MNKQQIIEFRKSRGHHDQTQQANNELPDQVDTDQHAGLLNKPGLSAHNLPGGLGGKLSL